MDKELLAKEILAKYNLSGFQPEKNKPADLTNRFAELDAIASGSPLQQEKRTLGEKILGFTGGEEIGQGLGQALNQGRATEQIEQVQSSQFDIQKGLLDRINEKQALGEDTSRLEAALQDLGGNIQKTGDTATDILNPEQLTDKQVIGDALQLGTTLGTIGGLSSAGVKATGRLGQIPGLTKSGAGVFTQAAGKLTGGGVGLLRGAARGALSGAASGVVAGGLTGAAQSLQKDGDKKDILRESVSGAGIGLVGGALVGGILGGATGAVKSRQLRKQVLNGQVSIGEKQPFDINNLNPEQKKAFNIAKTQGFSNEDIEFASSMNKPTKEKATRMMQIAESAQKNKRQIERPIDIAGDSMTDRISFIDKQNKKSGRLVDSTAKALKGQSVDATQVRERALSLLEDAGVYANPDGTPNWSKSVFSKTPALQKKMMETLSDLPNGSIDAYDLHNFKKSVDEVVNYGVAGEGLKGKSANILKAVRASADDVLDTTFEEYNKANTDFRITREAIDQAKDLFGKKNGFAKERGGQLLRSVFSNNTQRARVAALVEKLDLVSKQYGGTFEDNLLDQVLFTEMLEDIYGTQATTSLQGQVRRAVNTSEKVISGLRNPVKGAGEVIATAAEKVAGINDTNKKDILRAFLK